MYKLNLYLYFHGTSFPVSKEINIIYIVKKQMIYFHQLETDFYNKIDFKFSVCHY